MANFIGKVVFNKILGETVANKMGTEDPYFEYVRAEDITHKPNKKLKRVKKALPEGISAHDAKILTKVKRRAYRLDNNINICGIKFGWSSVIGIIPGFGDVLDSFLALMVVRTCDKIEGGLPRGVKNKMIINMILDFAVGLIPFLGDIADAFFRCNTKNAILLEKYLGGEIDENGHAVKKRKSTNRPEDDVEMRRPRLHNSPDTPPGYTRNTPDRTRTDETRRPERVVTNKSKKSGRWFGSDNSRQERDVERGEEPEYEYRPAQPPRP